MDAKVVFESFIISRIESYVNTLIIPLICVAKNHTTAIAYTYPPKMTISSALRFQFVFFHHPIYQEKMGYMFFLIAHTKLNSCYKYQAQHACTFWFG